MTAQNSTRLIGRVGNMDFKTITSKKDSKEILKAELSISQSNGKDKEGNWLPSSWFRIEVWGGQAEYLQKYAAKGSVLSVEGELKQQHYEDKDGNKREKYYVKALDRDGVYIVKSSDSSTAEADEAPVAKTASRKKPAVDLDDDELPPF